MVRSFIHQFSLGIRSPFDSARFLFQKKSLLGLGIFPHIVGIIIYFWSVYYFIITKWLHPFVNSLQEKSSMKFIVFILKPEFVDTIVWVLALLLYGALGISVINAFASPIYDIIATKTYEAHSKHIIKPQSLADFFDSILSEVTKAVIVIGVFIISLFLPLLAPLFFAGSIWYLGWNALDRTLLLLNLPFKERFRFGIENWALCVGLGIWCYIPLLAPLLGFTFATAGAILVAKTEINYLDDTTPGADF